MGGRAVKDDISLFMSRRHSPERPQQEGGRREDHDTSAWISVRAIQSKMTVSCPSLLPFLLLGYY
jgi:hypothetical protein